MAQTVNTAVIRYVDYVVCWMVETGPDETAHQEGQPAT